MTQTKFQGNGHTSKVKDQNDPIVQRSYVRLVHPETMKQLASVACIVYKLSNGPDKIFKVKVIMSRSRFGWTDGRNGCDGHIDEKDGQMVETTAIPFPPKFGRGVNI